MIIKNADFPDAGTYECILPQFKSTAELKISDREINIVVPLKDIKVPLQGNAIFETILDGPNAQPVWQKNGKKLETSTNVSFEEVEKNNGTLYRLTMKQQNLADSGKVQFHCIGNQCEQAATMTVMDLPLGFTKELESIDTSVNAPQIVLECHATRKTANARWYCAGKLVTSNAKYTIVKDEFVHKLTINGLTVEDNYEVTCVVEDKGDEAKSSGSLATRKIHRNHSLMKNMTKCFAVYSF